MPWTGGGAMSIVTTTTMVCDRCGERQDVRSDFLDAVDLMRHVAGGWKRAEGGKLLCGECAATHAKLVAKHECEMAEFWGAP